MNALPSTSSGSARQDTESGLAEGLLSVAEGLLSVDRVLTERSRRLTERSRSQPVLPRVKYFHHLITIRIIYTQHNYENGIQFFSFGKN